MADYTIPDEVSSVLRASTFNGNVLILPPGQLDRPLYEAVNKAIAFAGGKWKRGVGHVFSSDPRPKLGLILETGIAVDEKKKFQAFYTPTGLAEQLIEMACLESGSRVLEPSAGAGSLLRAMGNQCNKVAVEINEELIPQLIKLGLSGLKIHCADFMQCNGDLGLFDRVVMNPPFTKNQDVKHVSHALKFLKPGGILVAIMADNQTRKGFVELIDGRDYEISLIEAGAFSESGTNVRTLILKIRLP